MCMCFFMFTKERNVDGNGICLQLDRYINDDNLVDKILILIFIYFFICENVCFFNVFSCSLKKCLMEMTFVFNWMIILTTLV